MDNEEILKELKSRVGGVFGLSGYFKLSCFPSQHVFDLYYSEGLLVADILRTGGHYSITESIIREKFIYDLLDKEFPRSLALGLYESSCEYREYLMICLKLLRTDDPTFVSICLKCFDAWEYVDDISSRILVTSDREIDEIEDYRALMNGEIREYLSSYPGSERYSRIFKEPVYSFL